MIFQLDAAFAAEAIALTLGTGLLVLLNRWEIKSLFPKVVGIFVIVTSLLGMLCTGYYGYRYRAQGYFASPGMRMEKGGDMHGMMKEKCAMMEEMMGSETRPGGHDGMGPRHDRPKAAPEDHESHH